MPTAYEEIVARTRRRHELFTVQWELTYRCNERCSHCYLDVTPLSGKTDGDADGELTTAECHRVLDGLAEMGVLNLTLTGGEILARPDFFEIAEYARAKRFALRLFSNGALIDVEKADRIAALHPFTVEISIYSARSEVHDAITRRPRSWERSTRALELLRERGVRTVMKSPLMRENFHELDDLQALAGDLGAQFRYGLTITAKDNGSRETLRHRLNDEELLWVMRRTVNPADWVARSVDLDANTCSVGLNTLVLNPCGVVYPCVQTRIPAGNVRVAPVAKIWEESPIWEELSRLKTCELPACRACELRSLCVRCHGLARLEDGDLRGPSRANCREALARRQVLVEKGVSALDVRSEEITA